MPRTTLKVYILRNADKLKKTITEVEMVYPACTKLEAQVELCSIGLVSLSVRLRDCGAPICDPRMGANLRCSRVVMEDQKIKRPATPVLKPFQVLHATTKIPATNL